MYMLPWLTISRIVCERGLVQVTIVTEVVYLGYLCTICATHCTICV